MMFAAYAKTKNQRMMIYTGWQFALRVSELIQIRIKDFIFKAEKPGLYVRDEIAKNGGGGLVPILDPDYNEQLKKYIEERKLEKLDFLFNYGKERKPYTRYHVIKIFREIGERRYSGKFRQREQYDKDGKKKRSLFNPHMLRHSRARYLLEVRKAQVDAVKKFMRHESAVTTLDTYGTFTEQANIDHLRSLQPSGWKL